MRKWMIRTGLLLCYCVPFVFLAMHFDAAYRTMWFYVVMIAAFALLLWVSVKSKQRAMVLVGNAVSFLSSYICMLQYQTERWGWYFKPFTGRGLLIALSVATLLIQLAFMRNKELRK